MNAFILSAGLAFAIYELLALWHIPDTQTGPMPGDPFRRHPFRGRPRTTSTRARPGDPFRRHPFPGVTLEFDSPALRRVKIFARVLIVLATLTALLLIHQQVRPRESITSYSANIYLGFLFGPLLAIWVNAVIFHPPKDELSRGQIVAGIGLVLLFLLGSVGNETTRLLQRYSNRLSGLKLAGAELTFGERSHKDIGSTALAGSTSGSSGSTAPAGTNGSSGISGSSGLAYLAQLGGKNGIISRDLQYLQLFKPTLDTTQINKLSSARAFATRLIGPPLGCLLAWSQETGDSGPVDKHLNAFAEGFRQLATLKQGGQTNTAPDPGRLKDISTGFIRSGLAMAFDVMAASEREAVIEGCGLWLSTFCPEAMTWDDKGTLNIDDDDKFRVVDRPQLLRCLRAQKATLDEPPPQPPQGEPAPTNRARNNASELADELKTFIDQDSLNERPYFAIGYAGIMAQLGYYPAAASILDDWLRQQRRPRDNVNDESLVQNWFTVRARMFQAAYMEEWLVKEIRGVPTSVQDEHLANMMALRDGLHERLKNADFFKPLDKPCDTNCTIVLAPPAACKSEMLPKQLLLWQKLFTSYVSIESTYIERTVRHPEYRTRFQEKTNLEARRLANFDLSCSADTPDAWYAAVLAAFVQNAVNFTRARANNESQDTSVKRLDEADRAAVIGLQVVNDAAVKDRERGDKRLLERIQPSLTVQAQDELRSLRDEIAQIKKDLD